MAKIENLEGLADAMAGKFLVAALEAGLIKELGDLVPAVAALRRAAQRLAIIIRDECKAGVRAAVEENEKLPKGSGYDTKAELAHEVFVGEIQMFIDEFEKRNSLRLVMD